jgi:hypothetical protein
MSDLLARPADLPAGQRGDGSQTRDTEDAGDGGGALTREELGEILDQREQKLLQQLDQRTQTRIQSTSQSLTDHAYNRMRKAIADELGHTSKTVADLKAGGATITAEQERALRQAAVERVLSTVEEPAPGGRERQPSPEARTQPGAPVTLQDAALGLMDRHQTYLEENDKEFDLVDFQALERGDQTTFMESMLHAILTKKNRAASGKAASARDEGEEPGEGEEEEAQPTPRDRAAARLGGLGGGRHGAPSFEGKSAMDMLKQGYAANAKRRQS